MHEYRAIPTEDRPPYCNSLICANALLKALSHGTESSGSSHAVSGCSKARAAGNSLQQEPNDLLQQVLQLLLPYKAKEFGVVVGRGGEGEGGKGGVTEAWGQGQTILPC